MYMYTYYMCKYPRNNKCYSVKIYYSASTKKAGNKLPEHVYKLYFKGNNLLFRKGEMPRETYT